MDNDLRGIAELDRVIHEPARLLLVTILSTVESADFLFLQKEAGLTKGNLSAHLSKLEEAGYVEIKKNVQGKVSANCLQIDEERAQGVYRISRANDKSN